MVSWARRLRDAVQTRVATAMRSVWLGRQKELRTKELLASGQLVIGRYTYGSPEVVAYPKERETVSIGSFCSIADDVRIFAGGNHPTEWVSTFPFRIMFGLPGQHVDGSPTSKGDVTIGHDVWIGAGARVLSGVKIGNGAVIGASCVVASDVAPYAVVVGNPAREIRRRFAEADIVELERIAWWHWPLERIMENVELLCSPSLESFLAAHRTRGLTP